MKKFLLCLLLVFITGCAACIMKPERKVDDKGVAIEPDACYDYRVCMYYVVTGKLQSDCKLEYMKCCKDRDYDYCFKGPDKTFDMQNGCWDKKQ